METRLLPQVLALLLLACPRLSRALVLPNEPSAVIKSRLVPSDPAVVEEWRRLQDSDNAEALGRIKAAILSKLREDEGFFIATEGRVKVEHFPKGMKWDSSLLLPGANALSLLATSINIIFDGFKPEIMTKKLGDLRRSGDKRKVKRFESLSLLDLVSSRLDYNEDTFNELDARSKIFVDVANTLLGKAALEAWRDTFLSLGLDNSMFSGHNIISSSQDLFTFTKLILSELKAVKPVKGLAAEGQFAFGWWLNCDAKGKCLIPVLPSNTIFTLTPAFRMYVLLDIEVVVVVIDNLPNTDKSMQPKSTFTQELQRDIQLWEKLRKAIHDTENEDVESEAKDKLQVKDKSEIKEESQVKEKPQAKDKSQAKEKSPVKDKAQAKDKSKTKRETQAEEKSSDTGESQGEDTSQSKGEPQAKEKSPVTDKPQAKEEESQAEEEAPITDESQTKEEELQTEEKVPVTDEARAKDMPQSKGEPQAKEKSPVTDESQAKEEELQAKEKAPVTDESPAKDLPKSEDEPQVNDKLQDDSSFEDDDSPMLPEPLRIVLDMLGNGLRAYMAFTSRQNLFVRGILWLLFLAVGHVVVYWGVHLIWYMCGLIIPHVYQRRPKSAKVD